MKNIIVGRIISILVMIAVFIVLKFIFQFSMQNILLLLIPIGFILAIFRSIYEGRKNWSFPKPLSPCWFIAISKLDTLCKLNTKRANHFYDSPFVYSFISVRSNFGISTVRYFRAKSKSGIHIYSIYPLYFSQN